MSTLTKTPTADAELEQKTKFAEALLRWPDDPFKAAFSAIPETGKALQAANSWIRDPFVLSEKLRLIEVNGEKAFLPTKEDQAKDIYRLANDTKVDEEIRLKAHRLYAEIMGHIEKPAAGASVNVALQQNVMIVRDNGTDEEWEQRAQDQQRRLTIDAAS